MVHSSSKDMMMDGEDEEFLIEMSGQVDEQAEAEEDSMTASDDSNASANATA